MTNRKPISKRMRVDVFKRDSFTCQYCGKKAPEVVLNADHIKPVSKGGKNSLLNLVTSCAACNSGKSDKVLSDESSVGRAHRQAAEIQERRQQIEMMAEWYKSLDRLENDQLEIINSRIRRFSPFSLNQNGQRLVRKMIKAHGLNKVIDEFNSAFSEGSGDVKEFEKCFKRVESRLKYGHLPFHIQKARYLTGVIRNRFPKFWDWYPNFNRLTEWALEREESLYNKIYSAFTGASAINDARDDLLYLIDEVGLDSDEAIKHWNSI